MPTPTLTLYGIKTCDTCRKARRWLEAEALEHRYHDLRIDGLDAGRLDAWIEKVGVEALLNRRGTTWRKLAPGLPEEPDADMTRDLMLSHPSLIKRPIVESGDGLVVGFGAREQAAIRSMAGTPLADPVPGDAAAR